MDGTLPLCGEGRCAVSVSIEVHVHDFADSVDAHVHDSIAVVRGRMGRTYRFTTLFHNLLGSVAVVQTRACVRAFVQTGWISVSCPL